MRRFLLISVMAMLTIVSYGRKHVAENAVVVADTIYYAENMMNVATSGQASYYRLLMKQGQGLNKKNVFQDFYMNGTLRAEGAYSFIDLGNDANTILDGEITTYYKNGKEKWHGKYVNGKREGYFTMQMRQGGVAVVQFENGKSAHDYFTITNADGTMEKRPISDLKSFM
ncbi:VCBS domain-containing protein [Prevotella sp.]|uniref:VCBS domain-containing protein n=1 Tax=Prevotella sp. TaxID=59823 RepID=UPI003DA36A61